MRRESVLVAFLYVTGLAFGVDWAHAQTSPTLVTEASRMDQMASIQEGAKVIDKISAEFSSFLGSDAKTVVTGLRNGTPITLTSTVPGSTPGAPPVPPRRPLIHRRERWVLATFLSRSHWRSSSSGSWESRNRPRNSSKRRSWAEALPPPRERRRPPRIYKASSRCAARTWAGGRSRRNLGLSWDRW